jgi:hypothetical protein
MVYRSVARLKDLHIIWGDRTRNQPSGALGTLELDFNRTRGHAISDMSGQMAGREFLVWASCYLLLIVNDC